MSKCAELHDGNAQYGKTMRDTLGVEIKSFPTLPSNIANLIEGYEILYAERTPANTSVTGEGLVNYTNTDNVKPDSELKWTTGGNYAVYLRLENSNPNTLYPSIRILRLYSFDLLYNKSQALPTY